MTLMLFCLIYACMVNLQNPGAQIGGGAGIVAGILLAFAFGCLPSQPIAVAGLVAGSLLGGGTYAWFQQRYEIDGQNHMGDLEHYVPPQL